MFWGRKLVCGCANLAKFFKFTLNVILLVVDYLAASPMTTTSSSLTTADELASNDRYLQSLEKQLTIEMKVKNGTENMIQSISQNYQSRDKKLLAEAYTMLDDSKAKIEFLKLKILKVKQNHQVSDNNNNKKAKLKVDFHRLQPRTANSVRTNNSSRHLKCESKSCVIVCASKRLSLMAQKM